MTRPFKFSLAVTGLLVLLLGWPAYQFYGEIRKALSEDPLVWEDDVRALEKRAQGQYGPGEAVVFVGSSSIRLWDTLVVDMAPVPVLQQGFGGAKLNDVLHYADRLVSRHDPRAVVVFAGTNDITPQSTKSPRQLLSTYQALVARLREANPSLPIFYIAITPSVLRWEVWDQARATNDLILDWSATNQRLYVIDTGAALLGADGSPDPANYIFDGLHLSERGYAIWTDIIKPPLLRELGLPAEY